MNETKKGKFSGKGKAILGINKPTGIADFLDNKEDSNISQDVSTSIRTAVQPQIRTIEHPVNNKLTKASRGEFRFPEDLSEKLRQYAFDKRRNKTDVVIQALKELFAREGY